MLEITDIVKADTNEITMITDKSNDMRKFLSINNPLISATYQ